MRAHVGHLLLQICKGLHSAVTEPLEVYGYGKFPECLFTFISKSFTYQSFVIVLHVQSIL